MKEVGSASDFFEYCESLEISEIPKAYKLQNKDLKSDAQIQEYVLAKNGLAFEYFDSALKSDKDFILKKLGLSTAATYMLQHIDDSLVGNDELLEAACKSSSSFHKYLNKEKWDIDEDWYLKIAGYSYSTIYYMPKKIRNSVEMCKAFLDINSWSFEYFTDEMKGNLTVQRYALRKNGYVFKYFDENLKCDRDFIVSILRDCWGDDNAVAMIFEVCDELKQDQELLDLAIERDYRAFDSMYPDESRSKDLYEHYLKVTPKIFQFLPDDLKEDEKLFISMLSGSFDDITRKNLFEKSKYYGDKSFAKKLMNTTQYPGSLKYLSPELKSDPDIISIFTSKFQEAKHIGFIPNGVVTREIADFYMDKGFDAIYHIKDMQIAEYLFDKHRDKVLNEVRYLSPQVYRSINGKLRDIPDVFRAFMKNPMISSDDLDSVSYAVRSSEDLNPDREKLMEHLKKPFFKNLYKKKKKDDPSSLYQKGIKRKNYIETLETSDTDLLTLLISDQYRWVREAAAGNILINEQELNKILENGLPVMINKNEEWIIEFKHDRYVLQGFLLNDKVDDQFKKKIKEILKDEEKYPRQFDVYEIGFNGAAGLVESAAGLIEEEQVVDCIVEYGGNWEEYMLGNDWYNVDDFWHVYGVKNEATHVKLPDGTIEAAEILPRPDDEMIEEPDLNSFLEDSGEGFANISTSSEKSYGWEGSKKYKVKLEYEFDSNSVIPIYENGFCEGYVYKSDKETATFEVNDHFTTTGKGLDFSLYYFKNGECEYFDPSEIVEVMKIENEDTSDRTAVLKYLNYFLASYFQSYSQIIENNGYTFKSFPKNKLLVIPFDTTAKLLKWNEGADTFLGLLVHEEIPMEARLEKGIMYYGDHFMINDQFPSSLLLTTQGLVINNPNPTNFQEFIFFPFEDFNNDIDLYQQDAKSPILQFSGNNIEITITSKFTERNKPIVGDDELIFIFNIIKYWSMVAEVSQSSISIPLEAFEFLNVS